MFKPVISADGHQIGFPGSSGISHCPDWDRTNKWQPPEESRLWVRLPRQLVLQLLHPEQIWGPSWRKICSQSKQQVRPKLMYQNKYKNDSFKVRLCEHCTTLEHRVNQSPVPRCCKMVPGVLLYRLWISNVKSNEDFEVLLICYYAEWRDDFLSRTFSRGGIGNGAQQDVSYTKPGRLHFKANTKLLNLYDNRLGHCVESYASIRTRGELPCTQSTSVHVVYFTWSTCHRWKRQHTSLWQDVFPVSIFWMGEGWRRLCCSKWYTYSIYQCHRVMIKLRI